MTPRELAAILNSLPTSTPTVEGRGVSRYDAPRNPLQDFVLAAQGASQAFPVQEGSAIDLARRNLSYDNFRPSGGGNSAQARQAAAIEQYMQTVPVRTTPSWQQRMTGREIPTPAAEVSLRQNPSISNRNPTPIYVTPIDRAGIPRDDALQEGESVQSFAARHNLPLHQVLDLNQLTGSETLNPGTRLRLMPDVDVLREGESLDDLAARYGVQVRDILRVNQLDGYTVNPGQPLVIPPPARPAGEGMERIQRGETLEGFAQRVGVPVDEVRRLNNLSGWMVEADTPLRVR